MRINALLKRLNARQSVFFFFIILRHRRSGNFFFFFCGGSYTRVGQTKNSNFFSVGPQEYIYAHEFQVIF